MIARLSSARRAARGGQAAALAAVIAGAPAVIEAQRLLDYTPNTRAAWTTDRWQPAMILSHRFEFLAGGDELLNVPLITLGTAVQERIAIGLDFTSNSEVTTEDLGGNEAQLWLALRGPTGAGGGFSGMFAYNTAAASLDGAVTMRKRASFLSVIAEARGFSNAFGRGRSGFAATGGAVVHLTPYLSLAGDVGKAFISDNFGTVWTGGLTLALPGTRHHFSFHATNGGAATLQGASRKKAIGPESVRYGFAFIAPLGTASQWASIFRRGDRESSANEVETGSARVEMRNLAFMPDTVRIRLDQALEWVNGDPLAHTVRSDDKTWGSGLIDKGGTYRRRFTSVGTYTYHCEPHPQMKGVVIVEP